MERTYRIHVAAEMSGLSEGLIRAWERRYGVLHPRRTAAGYRAYTESDIEVLKRLKRLTEEGVAIAEAARLLPQLRREVKEELGVREGSTKPPRAAQLAAWCEEVLGAAARLDQQEIERVLDEAMASLPPVSFFEEVLVPLQREVGERWHQGRLTVAEEHLVTQAARQRVLALLHQSPRRAKHHVVCACLPNEEHELGLLGVALRFRHAGWRVTFLGGRTPVEHLARVVRTIEPDLVALSAVSDEGAAAYARTIKEVLGALGEARVAIGGHATTKYRDLAAALGAITVESPTEWEALLA